MNYLELITIIIVGWVAGAESGSWMCVHPVIAKLPPHEQIIFQKGLLKTFGKIMPLLMPLTMILVISLYASNPEKLATAGILQVIASLLLTSAIITTVMFNVPVNVATGHWNDKDFSQDWEKKRKLWRFFQGYRSIIFMIVFILVVISLQLK